MVKRALWIRVPQKIEKKSQNLTFGKITRLFLEISAETPHWIDYVPLPKNHDFNFGVLIAQK